MLGREHGQRDAWLRGALSVLTAALAAGTASPLLAQTATPPSPAGAAATAPAKPKPAPPKPKAKPVKPKSKPEPDEDEDDGDDAPTVVQGVEVRAQRVRPQPGAVVGDVKPELQLSPADVQSYGVSTVTELLQELAPQTRSDRGRGASSPVVLLNGRRISSISEVQNIPTEAILRVDILPEEVSLKYGYTADQRVVNIVLKRRFRAITGEIAGGETGHGDDAGGKAEVDQFQVRRDTRLNLDLKYQASAGLTYADRGLNANTGGAPFAFAGNVLSTTPGGQIDPALSALAGQPVLIAGVPATAANGQKPNVADFVPTAGVANASNIGADRSLAPATQALTANAVFAHPIFWGMNATVNATLGATGSDALQGLPGVSLTVPAGNPFSPFASNVVVDRYIPGKAPLHQIADGWTAHLGTTLNRDLGGWRLSLTDAYDHADTVTTTGVGLNTSPLQALLNQGSPTTDPFAAIAPGLLPSLPLSSARSISDSGNIQILANGPLLQLPAGALYVSAKIGDSESMETSTSLRRSVFQALNLSRNTANAHLNLDLPLASRTRHVLGFLGELSVNVNSRVDYLSDFGTLPSLGYGVNWTPVPGYNLIVSETRDHAAPTIQQLDGPVIETPDAPVFDYVTGQSVNVTQISGSNRALVADSRDVIKVGLTVKPIPTENFTFTANYIRSRIDNPIETFPSASAAIEAAFPDRFIRNAEGELIEEDISPVNFARQDRSELRWGFNYSRPVGKQPPPPRFDRRAFTRRRAAATGGQTVRGLGGGGEPLEETPDGGTPGAPGQGGAGGGAPGTGSMTDEASGGRGRGGFGGGGGGFGAGRGGRGGFGGGGRPVGGRFQIALYHTMIFKDQFLVRPGGPVLDLLNGAAAGAAGGQYQHEIEAQMGFTDNGYGMRMSADWRSATLVAGGAANGSGALDFSDVATINLRFWDDFSPQRALIARYPILRGVRVTLNITNLFDQSIRVRDTAGATPLIYQSNYLAPTGRVIALSLRKVFY
jgi:hypothetical protein